MPSRKRKRKPRGFRVSAPTVLWTLLIVNVAAGMAASPLTSVKKVRVSGVTVSDRPRVTRALQAARGVPYMRLNAATVSSNLASVPEVADASFKPNVFGRAVAVVTLRQAVAHLVGTPTCIDASGAVFVPASPQASLPKVVPPRGVHKPQLSVVGPWESSKVANLCILLKAQVPNVDWIVEVGDRGVISLRVEGGAEVLLGSSEGLPQKIEKLSSLLDDKPDLLKSVRQLNLTFPGAPVVVPR